MLLYDFDAHAEFFHTQAGQFLGTIDWRFHGTFVYNQFDGQTSTKNIREVQEQHQPSGK